jgi:mRNA interferase RelE/StbE
MAGYQVEFSKGAVKDYKKLPEQYKLLIDLALNKLSQGQSLDIKPIKGEKDTFRIRVGRYRILYVRIEHTMLITKIAHRKDAYK